MYKNLSEMAAHKKRLIQSRKVVPKEVVFPCMLLQLIAGNSFFQSTVFLYFTKVLAANHSSIYEVLLRRVFDRNF